MRYIFILIIVLINALAIMKFSTKKGNRKKVVGKVVGFESTKSFLYSQISPIISYEVNGKVYNVVMFLLTCDDTQQNRLVYINKEYNLYYDEKYPNRVKLKNQGTINLAVVCLLGISIMYLLILLNP